MAKPTLDFAAATELGNELTNKMDELAEAYSENADLRARTAADPRAVLVERGLELLAPPPGAEVRIVANTGDTVHFMLPPGPNAEMADDDLATLTGGAMSQLQWGAIGGSAYIAQGATRGGASAGQ